MVCTPPGAMVHRPAVWSGMGHGGEQAVHGCMQCCRRISFTEVCPQAPQPTVWDNGRGGEGGGR